MGLRQRVRLILCFCSVFVAGTLSAATENAGDSSASGKKMVDALQAGLDRVCQVGGASVGDRTMVDALAPALKALADADVKAAAIAARKGADSTAKITRAQAGRAAYVSAENLEGHNDPGAEAVAILFESLSE